MSDRIIIRRATADHHDILNGLQLLVMPENPLWPTTDSTAWWIGWADGEPVAFAALTYSRQFKKCGYFCRVGVLPSHRGQGLQKRLIRTRIAEARRRGWETLLTDAVAENAASINSLISCGFRVYKPKRPWALERSVYLRRHV